MKTRRILSLIVAIVALPLLVLGLIDPLEGGIALIFAALLGLAVWFLSRVRMPKFTWISFATSIGLGVLTLVIAILGREPQTVDNTASNPLATVPIAIIVLWAYRLSIVVTVAGAIVYVVQIARAMSPGKQAASPSHRRTLMIVGIVVGTLAAATALGATFAVLFVRSYEPPAFESLADNPQSSLHGTIAYFSDLNGCVRIVAAAGQPSKDVYCIPDEAIETKMEKGKPIGPHIAWLPDGRLQVTMFRMTDGGPGVAAGWQRIVNVTTGAVEEVPAADVPQVAPTLNHVMVSPTGERVTTLSDEGHATITLTQGSQSRTLLDVSGNAETYRMAPAYWAPNFEWIAGDDGRILIVTTADPSVTWVLTEDAGTTVDERFDRFAITSQDLLTTP